MHERTQSVLIGCGAALALHYLLAPHSSVAVVTKTASIALLFLVASMARAPKLLLAALAFSTFGDWFLVIRSLGSLGQDQLFLLGLASFLVSHICYSTLFIRNRTHHASTLRKSLSVVVVIAAAGLLGYLWPFIAPMRAPVIAYAIALSTMAASAQLSRFGTRVSTGALLFLASDAVLAVGHFRAPLPLEHIFVWTSYFVAQLCITTGVLSSGANHTRAAGTSAV